jgi:type II secretory pathway pseudopilin PulG
MTPLGPRSLLYGRRGFALLELLVAGAIVAMIGLGLSALYLSSTQAMDEGSTMAYLQRQGTQIQEDLARRIQRATVLEVDPYGAAVSVCHPADGANLAPGKSIIYQTTVGTTGSPSSPSTHEYWCVYEYKLPADASAQLWLCQVSGLTPPQTCLTTPAAKNLVADALRDLPQAIRVSATCFRPQGLDPATYPLTSCIPATAPSPLPCAGCPPSVDVTFAVDMLKNPAITSSSLVVGPWQFAFNLTIRN